MNKMSNEMRAKQFMPFAALKGYEEALRAKEKITVPKKELSEEECEDLDFRLKSLKIGSVSSITFYNHDEYEIVTGLVSEINTDSRYIKIVNKKIPLEDIRKISQEE